MLFHEIAQASQDIAATSARLAKVARLADCLVQARGRRSRSRSRTSPASCPRERSASGGRRCASFPNRPTNLQARADGSRRRPVPPSGNRGTWLAGGPPGGARVCSVLPQSSSSASSPACWSESCGRVLSRESWSMRWQRPPPSRHRGSARRDARRGPAARRGGRTHARARRASAIPTHSTSPREADARADR